ncbi:MAG: hypothetical protein ACOWWH_10115, partial [Eubacteriaceae bacterium]
LLLRQLIKLFHDNGIIFLLIIRRDLTPKRACDVKKICLLRHVFSHKGRILYGESADTTVDAPPSQPVNNNCMIM